ncbi:hypothetical protein [Paraclostridium tenue]|uniref:DUF4190 domain-containing protein n=1 Tax=Paraclostridium tenue TaxID=1737 RepID=A0ABP3XRN9_9FIRM
MEVKVKKSKKPMILGILSLISWSIPMLGLPVSIFGIVISTKRLKEYKCKAYKIGLILSIVGLVLTILYFSVVYYLLVNKII